MAGLSTWLAPTGGLLLAAIGFYRPWQCKVHIRSTTLGRHGFIRPMPLYLLGAMVAAPYPVTAQKSTTKGLR